MNTNDSIKIENLKAVLETPCAQTCRQPHHPFASETQLLGGFSCCDVHRFWLARPEQSWTSPRPPRDPAEVFLLPFLFCDQDLQVEMSHTLNTPYLFQIGSGTSRKVEREPTVLDPQARMHTQVMRKVREQARALTIGEYNEGEEQRQSVVGGHAR